MRSYIRKCKRLLTDSVWILYSYIFLQRKIAFLKGPIQKKEPEVGDEKNLILPILEMNHYQVFHLLILAKAMEKRGYDVTVIVCDEEFPGCEIKSSSNFDSKLTCLRCSASRRFLLPKFKFKVKIVSEIIQDSDLIFSKSDQRFVTDSVERYFYGGQNQVRSHVKQAVINRHTVSSAMSRSIGRYINGAYKKGVVLNNMNVYSQWGPLFEEIDANRFKSTIMSHTPFDINAVRFNILDLFRSQNRYQRFCSKRLSKKLSEEEGRALDCFLANRKAGQDFVFQEWNYYSEKKEKFFEKDCRNVVLFPNIPWDVGLNEFSGIYDNVFEWIEDTIELFSLDANIVIWIKIHPGEVKGTSPSKATVYDWLVNQDLPDNVKLIPPHLNVSPYHLFDGIDLGVIFSGTLGLEMLNHGIPVVSTGNPPYKGLQFGLQPRDRSEYQEMVAGGKFDRSETENIRLYSFFYFIFLSKKWPFTSRSFGDRFDGYTFNNFDVFYEKNYEDVERLCRLVENEGMDD